MVEPTYENLSFLKNFQEIALLDSDKRLKIAKFNKSTPPKKLSIKLRNSPRSPTDSGYRYKFLVYNEKFKINAKMQKSTKMLFSLKNCEKFAIFQICTPRTIII